VVVLERESFPRYHVGESLLPALWELWDRLGVTAQIEAADFVVKQGIRFARRDDPEDVVLLTTEYPEYFPRGLHLSCRPRALRCDPARQRARQGRRRALGLDGPPTW
jgi:2-polyprenyl-6-methoxyphenol hydroxylase-like FAD-dependent oxidoreductase